MKKVHSNTMNGEIKKTKTQASKDRYHVFFLLLNAVTQRRNFILSTYSVGHKNNNVKRPEKTLFIFRSIFQCFYFTWSICTYNIHVLFAFHNRYLLLLFNSILNKFSWIIKKKKRWMDLVFLFFIELLCTVSTIPFVCMCVSTKYINTRQKICIASIR